MLAIQKAYPTALILRQNTGVARDPRGQVVKFGTPGQGDLRCVVEGYAIEVEVKTPTGRQSKKQKTYQHALERAGGLYVLARSAQDALEQIDAGLRKRAQDRNGAGWDNSTRAH